MSQVSVENHKFIAVVVEVDEKITQKWATKVNIECPRVCV